jgi:uncharacterized protein YkwD
MSAPVKFVAVAVAAGAILAVSAPSVAASGVDRKPKPPTTAMLLGIVNVSVAPAPDNAFAVDVLIKNVSRRLGSVTVDFGDGSGPGQDETWCSAKQAQAGSERCAIRSFYEYATRYVPRDYVITVTVAGRAQQFPFHTQPLPISDEADWRQDMLDRVNSVRASVGAAPLRLCNTLNNIAQTHAQDMVDRNYYAHVTPEGVTPQQRGAAGGYGPYVGENIYNSPATVADAMAGWIASPGHYQNLIGDQYTDVGFGYAASDAINFHTEWVQNFGLLGNCG